MYIYQVFIYDHIFGSSKSQEKDEQQTWSGLTLSDQEGSLHVSWSVQHSDGIVSGNFCEEPPVAKIEK
jgi:hypothetical protein